MLAKSIYRFVYLQTTDLCKRHRWIPTHSKLITSVIYLAAFQAGTDFPAYSDTVYSDNPVTVTVLQFPHYEFVNKPPLLIVTIWLQ